jgi:phenylalanyl-tRNA synthetase beta chain
MLISMRWLGRHVDLSGVDPGQLAEELTLSTAEVEGLEPFAPHLSQVVVGHVLERVPHPDADKLGVCRVDVGEGEPLQIVCGAPNVAGGQLVAVARIGTVLPGDFKIKKSKIRGVESFGMICSERELELSEEHDGIWVLPEGLPVGAPVAEALEVTDWVLEIDNKSLTHRPDLWGHRGVAREVAAILGRELRPLETGLPELGSGAAFPVEVLSPACSRYLGLAIDGVEQGASPLWMRMLLAAVGQRPLDLLVDLSNFVMLDLGQPNHAFDRSALDPAGIVVRAAEAGERMQTLDGVERALTVDDLLITSGGEAVALAGVMGGEGSKVQGSTGQLLLEVATFAPTLIRRTSTRLGLRTDSSARFEKALDPTLPLAAAGHFAQLLLQLQPQVRFPLALSDAGIWEDPAHELRVSADRVRTALGVADLKTERMVELLRSIEFGVEVEGETLTVAVPSNRATKDITLEVDVIEEIGRLFRYGNIPEQALEGVLVPPPADPRRALAEQARDLHAGGARFHEALTYSFQADDLLATLGLADLPHVSVINPVQEGVSRIRRSVAPSLLGLLEQNRRQRASVRLFELGKGYRPEDASERGEPREVHELVLVQCQAPGDGSLGSTAFEQLQAAVAELARGLCLPVRRFEALAESPEPWAHPVRRVGLRVGHGEGVLAGWVGGVDPEVAWGLGLEGELESDTAIACLSIDALLQVAPENDGYRPLSRFPGVKVDVAVVAPEAVTAAEVAAAIDQAGKGAVRDLELFDLFRGEQLGAGRRSLAYHVLLQAEGKTLSDGDAQKFLGRLGRLLEGLGAELRA